MLDEALPTMAGTGAAGVRPPRLRLGLRRQAGGAQAGGHRGPRRRRARLGRRLRGRRPGRAGGRRRCGANSATTWRWPSTGPAARPGVAPAPSTADLQPKAHGIDPGRPLGDGVRHPPPGPRTSTWPPAPAHPRRPPPTPPATAPGEWRDRGGRPRPGPTERSPCLPAPPPRHGPRLVGRDAENRAVLAAGEARAAARVMLVEGGRDRLEDPPGRGSTPRDQAATGYQHHPGRPFEAAAPAEAVARRCCARRQPPPAPASPW